MNYSVRVRRSAERELDSLSEVIHERLTQAILSLEENPRPTGSKKLSGRGEHRLRVGVYRILYLINDDLKIVEIVAIGHRREAYR
jgi:mRNA interferase RelE/StbE